MKSLVSTAVVAIVASTLSAAEPLYVPAAQGDLPAATQPEVLVIPAPEPEPSRVAPAAGVRPDDEGQTIRQAVPQPQSARPEAPRAPQRIQTFKPSVDGLQPIPDSVPQRLLATSVPVPVVQPVKLYPRVKVRGPEKVHPLAVPQIIEVPNPCRGECDPVLVEVCLPPCQPLDVCIDRRGRRVTYDYGAHQVRIASRLGVVVVAYN